MDQIFVPGDFILVHGNGFFDKLIQWGEHFRFSHKEAYWNHAALVVDAQGSIVEALSKGVRKRSASKYPSDCIKYVAVEMSDEDRAETVKYAESCTKEGYGFLEIVSAGLRALFGFTLSFGFSDQCICSGLVAKSLEHGGKILKRDAANTSPSDLAKQFLKI